MWIVAGGFDRTDKIPIDTIQLKQTINDPTPTLDFDVRDDGSLLSFNILDEIIVWNENPAPEPNIDPAVKIPAVPAHNLVQMPNVSSVGGAGGGWTGTGALAGIITGFPGLNPTVPFANNTYTTDNTAYLTSVTPSGYVHAGQQYMFSIYATISTPLTNALAVLKMQFQDGGGNLLGSPTTLTFSSTTNNQQQRVNISATAPAGAYYIQVWFGGQATVSGNNSGTITFGTPQVEPMWFAARNVAYPTPDCNFYQADCAAMPDNTTSRMVRLFSGYISDFKKEYIGPNRIWHIQCAGPGAILENGLINQTFTNATDIYIIQTILFNYFFNQIGYNQANSLLPSPLVQGVTLSSVSYSDNTLREILNGLVDASGYIFYLDPYYRLYYQPQYYATAAFALSDSPDNMTSFPYYTYEFEQDGTQLKRRIKINGGKFHGTWQDVFSGDGSTKQFNLTFIPGALTSITIGGTAQHAGVYGRDSFSSTSHSYDVLLNKQAQYVLFKTAPTTGTNNVVVTYTYEAPVSTQTNMQTSTVIAPPYNQPLFDAKINDTNITDLTTATTRGLAEIAKWGSPLQVLTLSSQQFAPAGTAIYFSSAQDGINTVPFIVQSVTGIMKGKDGISSLINTLLSTPYNEFQYTLGAYQPSLTDHIRNANKALNRSSTVANVNAQQQTDFVAMETIIYRDSLSATPQTSYAAGRYGNAGSKYGSCSYGGSTGRYGGPGTYGQSTIYG